MVEACFTDRSKTYFHPIIDWSSDEVWEFIHKYELSYCGLYDEGFDRIGCILCPMARAPERDMERWPKFARAYIRTFDKLIEVRTERGLKTTFKTGQAILDWWIMRNTKKIEPQQTMFGW